MAEIEITGKQIGQLNALAAIAGSEKIPVETADGNGHVTTQQIKEYAQPDLSDYATKAEIPSVDGLLTETKAAETYQPIGDYATKAEIPSTEGLLTETEADGKYATKAEIDGIGGVGKPGEGKNAEIFNDYTNNQATEMWSHAEGNNTIADNIASHAEGSDTKASGACSHAEGASTEASGYCSHAEGEFTNAAHNSSHAEGIYTIASNAFEHAEGMRNVSNTGETDAEKTRHSVGIGTGEDDCKNAFEIMANGDIYVYGLGGYDGTNALDEAAKTLQTVLAELQSAQAELQQAQKYAVRAVWVSVGDSGLATFTPEVALDFTRTAGVAAYTATVTGSTVNLTRTDTVAAGEGVLLRSLDGGAAGVYVPLAEGDVSPTEGNMFVGVLETIEQLPDEQDGYTNFILNSKGVNGSGFYLANNKTVAAGKAYLRVPSDGAPGSVILPQE